MVQKQTYGIMEQGREPRNKPKHLWSINLCQRRQGWDKWGKDSLFSKQCQESGTAACNSKLEHKIA